MVLTALLLLRSTTVDLVPTDDVWVYPHASDPSTDPYLRCWGVDGLALPTDPADLGDFSFSLLKFDVRKVQGKIASAELILTHNADPAYSAEQAKSGPLEARPVGSAFNEKAWTEEMGAKCMPGKELYGSVVPADWPAGKPFTLTIDLTKGKADFKAAIAKAISGDGTIAIALTSKISAENRGVYKVFSKDAEDKAKRPILRLKLD